MSTPEPPTRPPLDAEDALRPHTYDGIREYDKRLPNWWLYTLYGSIGFWVIYWFAHVTAHIIPSDGAQLDAELARVATAKMAASIDVSNDDRFWEMSRAPAFVSSGQQTFNSLCAACHLPSMRGKSENPAAVGPDLTDTAWIHGGTPQEIYRTVSGGVLAKGMPAWEPVLGQKKVVEAIAYILSKHQPGEAITLETPK